MPLYRYQSDPDVFVSYFAMTQEHIRLLRLLEPPESVAFKEIELRTENLDALETDFPAISVPTPLLSDRALAILGPMLAEQVTVHRIRIHGSDDDRLNALRVLTVVRGAVDLTRSDCTINAIAKTVSVVRSLAVDLSLVPDVHMFKFHETRNQHTYVSEAFIAAAQSAGLKGFGYREVPLVV